MFMAKPSDQPGFKDLLAEWNKKLRDSGFKDAERIRFGRLVPKKTGSQHRYEAMDPIVRQGRIDYFRTLTHLVATTSFDKPLEQQIMALYAQGVTQAMIKRVLEIEGNRSRIYDPIYKWLKLWGLK